MYLILITVIFSINQVLSSDFDSPQDKIFYNVNDYKDLFAEYVEEFDKSYNKIEYKKREQIFKDNLRSINELNKKYDNTVFGINQFTDVTYEELSRCYMGVSGNYSRKDAVEYKPRGYAPEELDYRSHGFVTGVKNQNSCGACFAFSAVANIESVYAMKYKQLISLSEQQGFDCEPTGTCKGGQPHNVMQALAQQGGSMRNEDYPYENKKGVCRTVASKIVVKVTGGSSIGVSEGSLADALANYGPLSIYLKTCPEFQAYSGGVFSVNCNGEWHAVLLIGYGKANGESYWIIKNSWSPAWGEQGYMRLKRGSGVCNIGYYAACATVA